jgi:hypothetical protein
VNKRFEARWLLENGCESVVTSAWSNATDRGAEKMINLITSVYFYISGLLSLFVAPKTLSVCCVEER